MNRAIVGLIALIVFVGIIFLAYRAVSSVVSSRLFQRPVQTTGKLSLPSGISATNVSPSPAVLGVTPSPQIGGGTIQASPVPYPSSAFTSPRPFVTPSSTTTPATGGGRLPATGL